MDDDDGSVKNLGFGRHLIVTLEGQSLGEKRGPFGRILAEIGLR